MNGLLSDVATREKQEQSVGQEAPSRGIITIKNADDPRQGCRLWRLIGVDSDGVRVLFPSGPAHKSSTGAFAKPKRTCHLVMEVYTRL